MESEKSLEDLLRQFQKRRFRYLVIGGQAVAQYGSSLTTNDLDIWIDPSQREEIFEFLAEQNIQIPEDANRRPILALYSDLDKIDIFSARKFSNLEGRILEFDQCYRNATHFKDAGADLELVVPSIEDLIALKKMRKPTPKDYEDIAFLERLLKKK